MSYLFNDQVQIVGEAVRTSEENHSQFGETVTAKRNTVFHINSSYGTSVLRDRETVSGSGSIISSGGKITLSTGNTAGSVANLDSVESGVYISGFGGQIGIGVRIGSDPTGNQEARWGGLTFDTQNGFYFGMDANGLYVARRSGGVESQKTYKSSFNIDPLDGSGRSGIDLSVDSGIIYEINFTWYGYGQILFGIVAVPSNNIYKNGAPLIQTFIPCHSMKIDGEVSTESPSFKIHTEVSNGSDATGFSIDVGGRQYSILGEYNPNYRYVSDYKVNVPTSTTEIPLISFRRKTSFSDRSILLEGFESIVTTEPCLLQIRVDATLTDAVFDTSTNHTASEISVESDTSATSFSGGIVIWQQLVSAGTNKNIGVLTSGGSRLNIPDDKIVTLTAMTLSGTGAITPLFRIREEW